MLQVVNTASRGNSERGEKKMNSGTGRFVAPGKTHEDIGAPLFARRYLWPFILVTSLFFLWGIAHNLNELRRIRQFMSSFEITRFKAGPVQSAFYLGYFLLSMPASLLMRRFGYKSGLVSGLPCSTHFGTLLFWPAALVGSYYFFLFALFVICARPCFLETGANPFIARVGRS